MVERVLFVCTANLCRSPMAEALLRGLAAADPELDGLEVASAGTFAWDGGPATAEACRTVQRRGLDLSGHRSRRIDDVADESWDLILTMTGEHAEHVRTRFPALAPRVHVLGDLVGSGEAVHDPFGNSQEAYEEVATQLESLLTALLPVLRSRR